MSSVLYCQLCGHRVRASGIASVANAHKIMACGWTPMFMEENKHRSLFYIRWSCETCGELEREYSPWIITLSRSVEEEYYAFLNELKAKQPIREISI